MYFCHESCSRRKVCNEVQGKQLRTDGGQAAGGHGCTPLRVPHLLVLPELKKQGLVVPGSSTRIKDAGIKPATRFAIREDIVSANLLRALSVSDLRAQSLQDPNSMTTSPGNLLALEPWFQKGPQDTNSMTTSPGNLSALEPWLLQGPQPGYYYR